MTTTAQTIAEFIIASALHYGPGPHPDGSPQQVHAGGARADAPAGRPRPKPGKDQIGFDLDVSPPAAAAPTADAGQAAAEAVRQQVLAVSAEYTAKLKAAAKTAQTWYDKQMAVQRELWDKHGNRLPGIPEDDPRMVAWEDAIHRQSQALAQTAALQKAQIRAVNELIETDQVGFYQNQATIEYYQRNIKDLPSFVPVRADWTGLAEPQRKAVTAGLRQFNRLVGQAALARSYGQEVRFGPADPAKGYGQRAYYDRNDNSVRLTTSSSTTAVIHELGHSLETKTSGLGDYARAFLDRRTADETAKPLADLQPTAGYDPSEQAKRDKFRDAYVGKVYAHGATEAISMGLEYMATDPVAFAKQDPDHFRFTYTVMRGTWRQP